jgi:hypothetical protein
VAKKKYKPQVLFSELVDAVIMDFKGTKPQKIIVDTPLLLASAREEADKYSLSNNDLKLSIERCLSNDFKEEDQMLVKAASYACQVVANHCFVNEYDEDFEVPMVVEWVVHKSTGDYFAIVKKKED